MDSATALNRKIALLGIRLVIGFLTCQLAMHKIFIEGLQSQMQWFEALGQWFPNWLLWTTNIYAAAIELIGGIMLVLGIKRDWALWAILSVIVIVNFGHGLEAAAWDIEQLVFRLSMIAALLLLPARWDAFQLENLPVFRRKD